MPFESAKQRKWMFINKPAMARRWADEEKEKAPKKSFKKVKHRKKRK